VIVLRRSENAGQQISMRLEARQVSESAIKAAHLLCLGAAEGAAQEV